MATQVFVFPMSSPPLIILRRQEKVYTEAFLLGILIFLTSYSYGGGESQKAKLTLEIGT